MIHQNDGRAGYIANTGSLPYRVVQLFKQDLIGEGQPIKALLTAICAAAVVIALGLLVRAGAPEERTAALMPLAVGLGGVVVAIVVAKIGTDYFNTRNLLPTWPALMLVVATGLGVCRAGRLGALGAAMLVIVGLFCVVNVDPTRATSAWTGAAPRASWARRPAPGDRLRHPQRGRAGPIPARPGRLPRRRAPVAGGRSGLDAAHLPMGDGQPDHACAASRVHACAGDPEIDIRGGALSRTAADARGPRRAQPSLSGGVADAAAASVTAMSAAMSTTGCGRRPG